MAVGKRSNVTRRTQMLVERMFEQYLLLVEEFSPPLGLEQVSLSELQRRWSFMSPEERQQELIRRGQGDPTVGAADFIQLLRTDNARA